METIVLLLMVQLTYKQYLVSNKRIAPRGMVEFSLTGGYYLYTGDDLKVREGKTHNGERYILLGEAFCTDQYPKEVIEDLESSNYQDGISASRYWTGRWVLIIGSELITDASGLMSAFYHEKDDSCMVSSSLALLSYQLGLSCDKKVSTTGLTWCMLPSTIQDSIKLMFCTQKMCLGPTLLREFCNRYNVEKELSFDERVHTITQCLSIGIKNIEKFSGRQIWIALTAGKDSRLVLAAALAAKVDFVTYTMEHNNISSADRKLPAQIAKDYGKEHRFIRKNNFDSEKYNEYVSFTGNNSLGADAEFYANGQFLSIPNNAIVIRSGLFEAGQTYARRIAGGNRDSFVEGFSSYYKQSLKDSTQQEAFKKWLDYQAANPMFGIDIRDRFYLEQRVNGWVAAIEQSLDINQFVSIQIANCSAILNCLLGATDKEREGLKLSLTLIEQLDKRLLDYPINKRTLFDRINYTINGIKKRLV